MDEQDPDHSARPAAFGAALGRYARLAGPYCRPAAPGGQRHGALRSPAAAERGCLAADDLENDKGGAPAALRVTSQENIDLFFRYLHRRMCVRVQMHQDKTILKKVPKPPMDPVLDLCTMGNAYRHLDSDDHAEGLILREYTGAALDARPTDKQLATMLIPCMLRVAGFNGQRMSEAVGRARGEHVDAESILAFPLCKAEALAVAAELRAVAAMPHNERPKRPSWFEGDASQVQGFGKWADAFALWFDESKPAGTLKQAVAEEEPKTLPCPEPIAAQAASMLGMDLDKYGILAAGLPGWNPPATRTAAPASGWGCRSWWMWRAPTAARCGWANFSSIVSPSSRSSTTSWSAWR